ncbi:MAG: helix-turn-helix domain-containing protein [Pseudanabaena sp. Salubria-1]|nr:helix-turn-helix domain-containing protein [Pseudanabaena sp. Salubria-1]
MSFVHLTTTERSELYKLRVIEQLSVSEIGRRLKRNKSTISRERQFKDEMQHLEIFA